MENTNIEWATHTWNPWIGCTKVSPGCAHCYAEARDKRFAGGAHWGKGAPRLRTSYSNWLQPRRWDKAAAARGVRERVFCASLADIFDPEVPLEWLQDAMEVMDSCPHLDWLLLTKRPHLVRDRLGAISNGNVTGFEHMPNVWIGTSCEDQSRADERIPHLLDIPARVRFLSCEPLLGPVVLPIGSVMTGFPQHITGEGHAVGAPLAIHWIICGGESGPGARPMHPDWARSMRDQCAAAGVPFLFKQWGEWCPASEEHGFSGSVMPESGVIPCGKRAEWIGWDGTLQHPSANRPIRLQDPVMAIAKAGKAAAGRVLDGRTHDEFPASALAAA